MESDGFPCGSPGKESACNVGDLGMILGLDRSPGEGRGYPLEYSGLENFMDKPFFNFLFHLTIGLVELYTSLHEALSTSF